MSPLEHELAQQLKDSQVLVMVGTGVSVQATNGATVASWKGLIENGIKRCHELNLMNEDDARYYKSLLERDDVRGLLTAAEQVSTTLGWTLEGPIRGEWSEWLEKTVGSLTAAKH